VCIAIIALRIGAANSGLCHTPQKGITDCKRWRKTFSKGRARDCTRWVQDLSQDLSLGSLQVAIFVSTLQSNEVSGPVKVCVVRRAGFNATVRPRSQDTTDADSFCHHQYGVPVRTLAGEASIPPSHWIKTVAVVQYCASHANQHLQSPR
jgi:hypothetical protein